ncbi:hypothetical protein J2S77_002873 [Alkalibacillus salilacus]|uniref:Uncharacterized protein n=1 Tax=Alkalibacillus salilacus TaxID=284582 RepID=A0ABT9VIS8_9BACI|nr:hypothetical protein [Alkalibacillus salilacus]
MMKLWESIPKEIKEMVAMSMFTIVTTLIALAASEELV